MKLKITVNQYFMKTYTLYLSKNRLFYFTILISFLLFSFMKKNVLLAFLICSFIWFSSVGKQMGSITGQIIDNQTGEALIGATVIIKGTVKGASSNIDGNFTIPNLESGAYTLKISYISYTDQIIEDVVVEDGKLTMLKVNLNDESETMEEVVISSKALQNNSSSILLKQRRSANILDGISAEEFSLYGDNNAAGAIRRVVGVSIEGGKYIYVRGLGDRYNKVTLNGAEIPSLDPNKNAVQINLFPSSLLDNIIVYKNHTPDLPANFSGGYVDLTLKDFPDSYTLKSSISISYNPQSNLNTHFLSYNRGRLDALAINDKTRSIPQEIQQAASIPNLGQALANPSSRQVLSNLTKSFNNYLNINRQKSFVNHNFNFSVGNNISIKDKPFGYIFNLNYQRRYNFYENGETGRFTLGSNTEEANSLIPQLLLKDSKSTDNVLWGALFNASISLSNFHKISFSLIHNRNSENITRFQEGSRPEDDVDLFYQTRNLSQIFRNISTGQLRGEHSLAGNQKWKANWLVSYTLSNQEEPDLRFFTNGFRINQEGERVYTIEPSIGQIPTRYWRSLREHNLHTKANIIYNLTKNIKFKFGGNYLYKSRNFQEDQYRYASTTRSFSGDPVQYVRPENIISSQGTDPLEGVYLLDAYEARNNYDAHQTISAFYAMGDILLVERLQILAGLRAENTEITLQSLDPNSQSGKLRKTDILPTLNLTYRLKDNMNLRFSYTQTLARPSFRELAPYASFDFVGDFILVGNPNLQRSLTTNFDLRWEFFFSRSEKVAFSLFYKDIKGAIERIDNPIAANPEINFRNLDKTKVYGAEVEIKTNLLHVWHRLEHVFISANGSWIVSEASIPDDEFQSILALDLNANPTRQLYGQSPFVVNTSIYYDNFKKTKVNLSFNIQGPRLALVIRGATPDVFEQARPNLNFSIVQKISPRASFTVRANNLLNPEYAFTQTFKGEVYNFQTYRMGRVFSVGFKYNIN